MFFPLLKTEKLSGFLDLVYFPPNNWEHRGKSKVALYAIWSDGENWRTEDQGSINFGEHRLFEESDFGDKLDTGMCLIYPSLRKLNNRLDVLPTEAYWSTNIPEWRATTGFKGLNSQTSYQSEVFPLPSKASMLTFHPFIQYGNIENRLLVLNVTKVPEIITSHLLLYDSHSGEKFGTELVQTNSLSTINLDKYAFKPDQLPAFIAPKMAGIPFGLGIAPDTSMLSMEHTHPPASLVLFGDRNAVQGTIKRNWLNSLMGDSK